MKIKYNLVHVSEHRIELTDHVGDFNCNLLNWSYCFLLFAVELALKLIIIVTVCYWLESECNILLFIYLFAIYSVTSARVMVAEVKYSEHVKFSQKFLPIIGLLHWVLLFKSDKDDDQKTSAITRLLSLLVSPM